MDGDAAVLKGAGRLSGGAPGVALLVTGIAALTIVSVWVLQNAGYTPCELCLLEREPFYAAIPMGAATALAAWADRPRWAALGFGLLVLLFIGSAGLAAYHAGVEWGFWPGPSGCSGAVQAPAGVDDFLKQLDTVKVVRCDAAAMRVLGLSLAGWNVLVSIVLAGTAWAGLRRSTQQ